jgi:hypothetical protein
MFKQSRLGRFFAHQNKIVRWAEKRCPPYNASKQTDEACKPPARLILRLLLVLSHSFVDLRFHSIEIEACALLHRRKLFGSHGELRDMLLDKHKRQEVKQALPPVYWNHSIVPVIVDRKTDFLR